MLCRLNGQSQAQHTRDKDVVLKWDLYRSIGVAEYILYDPHGNYLTPPLQGYTNVRGAYLPMEQDRSGALLSNELDARLLLIDGTLHLYDRNTGREILSPVEELPLVEQRFEAERVARIAEQTARIAAEARIAELEARLRVLDANHNNPPSNG